MPLSGRDCLLKEIQLPKIRKLALPSLSWFNMGSLSNFQYILITVFILDTVASFCRTCRVWLVFRQNRESPEHPQDETIMLKHKTIFLLIMSGQFLLSTATGVTFLVLALSREGYWAIIFSMFAVTISTAGQASNLQISRQNTANTYSVHGWLVNGMLNAMAATCS